MSARRKDMKEVLIRAAQIIETIGPMHPAQAICYATPRARQQRAAWRQLIEACGLDYMDFDAIEVSDCLIAAAYWRTP